MKLTGRILLGSLVLAVSAAMTAAQITAGTPGVQLQPQPSAADSLVEQLLRRDSAPPRRNGGGGQRSSYGEFDSLELRDLTRLEERDGVDLWTADRNFPGDAFTFVRLQFGSGPGASDYDRRWLIDYPYSDMNFTFRLQQMTSLKVDSVPIHLRITDADLLNYPFAYMLEVGTMRLSAIERDALRRYLLNGGFLMVDDHWGLDEQANFIAEIQRVFPERPLKELDISHPIFHCLFNLKSKPQIPSKGVWQRYGRTWERADDTEPHYRALFDDKGRMMMIECANTDLGDGWEREGDDEEFFHTFSENQAFPLGINIVYYAMTH